MESNDNTYQKGRKISIRPYDMHCSLKLERNKESFKRTMIASRTSCLNNIHPFRCVSVFYMGAKEWRGAQFFLQSIVSRFWIFHYVNSGTIVTTTAQYTYRIYWWFFSKINISPIFLRFTQDAAHTKPHTLIRWQKQYTNRYYRQWNF